jgi:nitronate monooxygenase
MIILKKLQNIQMAVKIMWENDLTKLLQIKYPIIQAPMAGGVTTPELVAAVSNAGGLGMIGAGYLTSVQLSNQIRETRKLTNKNFGVNLFVPTPYAIDEEKLQTANQILQGVLTELGIKDQHQLPTYDADLQTFHEQINILIEEKIPVISFTFGLPSKEVETKLKQNSSILIGTATTVKEAILNEKAGMDAVVMQGVEAGGHRGTFYRSENESLIGLMSLIPQTADTIGIPIIAAGGIMDARGVMAAKCLGAQAVQMGTAFLVCEESGANNLHKNAIVDATEDQIVLTKSFSGKLARGIHNRFIEKFKDVEHLLPDYPLQNELTKAIRKAAALNGTPDYLSLWSGQSPRSAKQQTVKELFQEIIIDVEKLRY